MKKPVTKKTLRLDVETVRTLDKKELTEVAAAGMIGTRVEIMTCNAWVCYIGW